MSVEFLNCKNETAVGSQFSLRIAFAGLFAFCVVFGSVYNFGVFSTLSVIIYLFVLFFVAYVFKGALFSSSVLKRILAGGCFRVFFVVVTVVLIVTWNGSYLRVLRLRGICSSVPNVKQPKVKLKRGRGGLLY